MGIFKLISRKKALVQPVKNLSGYTSSKTIETAPATCMPALQTGETPLTKGIKMGLGSWPITVALWAGGALIVFFTRQGISRDSRLTIGIAAWFFLMGAAVLADSPIALAFLICVPLGAGMVWAGIMPLLDAASCNIKINATYRGHTPEIESRETGRQVLTFSYNIEDARLTGTSVDTFTTGQIERRFTVGKKYPIWVNKNDLTVCKVNRFENIALVPLALIVGAIFIAVPFIRLLGA